MINIDERIFHKVDNTELILLIHITKRLGKNLYCFPSNKTLMRDTGWKTDKLREIKNSLIEKGILKVEVVEGRANRYYVKTSLIGVYVTADKLSEPPSEKPSGVEKPIEPGRKNQPASPSEKPTDKYYQDEVLKSKVSVAVAPEKQKIIDEKIAAFKKTTYPFIDQYGIPMLKEFCDYWAEPAVNSTKLKWELEKTWDVRGRLARWHKNDLEKQARQPRTGPTATPTVASSPESYHTTPRT